MTVAKCNELTSQVCVTINRNQTSINLASYVLYTQKRKCNFTNYSTFI